MLKPATMMILSADEAPIVILTAIVIEYQKEYSTLSKNIQEYQDISKNIKENPRTWGNIYDIERW